MITGDATNLTDNAPLDGYEVHLIETETPSSPFSSVSVNTIATTACNVDGKFSFEEVLSTRNRYRYTVEFDGNDELFAPEAWNEETIGTVNGIIAVTPGETNQVSITQVKLGSVNYVVTNNSDEQAEVSIYTQSDQKLNRVFWNEVDAKESFSYNLYQEMPIGNIEFVTVVTRQSNADTLHQEFLLEHNEMKDLEIVFE